MEFDPSAPDIWIPPSLPSIEHEEEDFGEILKQSKTSKNFQQSYFESILSQFCTSKAYNFLEKTPNSMALC